VRHDAVLRVAVGLEPFVEQRRVAGDQAARHFEDLPGAAAVPIQHHGDPDLEVGPEALEDGGVGAGPAEDRLLVVAHGEAVAMDRREPGDDGVLRQAQVLELVHQDGVPVGADLRRRGLVAPDQLARERDEVVVVEQVASPERVAVGSEQLQVAGGERGVLQPVPTEEAEELGHPLGADPEPLQHPPLVVLVRDAEAAAQAHDCGVVAEQPVAERVQRAAGDGVRRRAQVAAQAIGDLVRRLVGEGDGADPARRNPGDPDQVFDAADEAEGLAGSRAGDHQHGAEWRFDGALLSG
jgi:hypothetical protein